MTNTYVTHKKLEQKYHGTIPKSEKRRMRLEGEAATRMTNILKMMHSPHNFQQPGKLLPGQKVHPLDGKDRKTLGGTHLETSYRTNSISGQDDKNRTNQTWLPSTGIRSHF